MGSLLQLFILFSVISNISGVFAITSEERLLLRADWKSHGEPVHRAKPGTTGEMMDTQTHLASTTLRTQKLHGTTGEMMDTQTHLAPTTLRPPLNFHTRTQKLHAMKYEMERGEDAFLQFLLDHGIREETINKLKDDKALSKYIPHYGDGLAAVAFCRNSHRFDPGTSIERIRAKVCAPESKASGKRKEKRVEHLERLKANKNSKKKARRVDMGWVNFNEKDNDFKQVQTVKGGGIRPVSVDGCTTVRKIQESAESLFSPNGVFKSLKLEDHVRGGMYAKEMRQDQGAPEMETEFIRQEQEDQNAAVTGTVIPEAQAVEMLLNTSTDDEVTFGASSSKSIELDDTLPWEGSKPRVIIEVRRGHCLTDLLAAFIDPDIMNKDVHIKRKLPNGKLEEGEGSGVLCQCLSEFWGEFYSKCTVGTDVKTPYLRHEYQVQEWQAVAKILVMGWTTVRYFPLLLPLPFLEEALYGTSFSSVTDSFLKYVPTEEKKILELSLESFQSVDKDDLMDVLDTHDCHYLASEDTISGLVSQLGHKTLIQTPMFVIECWKPILKTLSDTLYPQRLVEIMEERVPTPKRVKGLLKFPEKMTARQTTVARYLKGYIGESDNTMLKSFLRFCTGADILLGHPITVQFIETSAFHCRPQAHTCGCYLMLPINYQNYLDLRNDFDLVLRSSTD